MQTVSKKKPKFNFCVKSGHMSIIPPSQSNSVTDTIMKRFSLDLEIWSKVTKDRENSVYIYTITTVKIPNNIIYM